MSQRIIDTVRQRRVARGWSMRELGEKIGATVSTVNRIEAGETKLVNEIVLPLAAAFGIRWQELFLDTEAPVPHGFGDDAAPYVVDKGDPLAALTLGDNRDLWVAKSGALDAIGIEPGTPIVVNISADAVAQAGTGDPVIVQWISPDNPLHGETLMRQFIEPDLFVTNSRAENAKPLNRREHDVRVKGIIERVIAPVRPVRR